MSVKPSRVFPAPTGLEGAGAPQPNGTMWLLSGSAEAKNIQALDVSSGKLLGIVAVGSSASAVTELSTGVVVVGTAGAATGSVELHNGTSGALLSTIPVSAPVKALAPGADGSTVFALEGSNQAEAVAIIDAQEDRVVGTVPVSLGTVGVAPTPSGSHLYALEETGTVDEIAVAGGKPTARFPVGHSGRALALSPDGSTLYVLKGQGSLRDVAVVQTSTEAVTKVLPAPAYTVGLAMPPDGNMLYDVVGASTYGNVQAYSLTG